MMTDGIRNVLTVPTALCQTVRLNLISVYIHLDSHGDLDLALLIRPRANPCESGPEVHSTEPQHGGWAKPLGHDSDSNADASRWPSPETSRPLVPPNVQVVDPLRWLRKHLPNLLRPTFCTSPSSTSWPLRICCMMYSEEVWSSSTKTFRQSISTKPHFSRRDVLSKCKTTCKNCTYYLYTV